MSIREASRAIQPASPFAALLRRSRFASYDPAISQVYTSYDGEVYRGNWGVKRPLPLRRRNAFVTFKSIDSNEQQTEFNRAEHQARFISRWNEVSGAVRPAQIGNWATTLGKNAEGIHSLIDSEFSPYADTLEARAAEDEERQKALQRSNHVTSTRKRPTGSIPNIAAMPPRQFERYVAKLRELRPEFEAWVKEIAQHDPRYAGKSLADIAKTPSESIHREFIAYYTSKKLESPHSRLFESKPHLNAGLSYATPSPLQTSLTTRAQPGLVLQSASLTNRRSTRRAGSDRSSVIVSFAGIGASLPNPDGKQPLYNPDSAQGMHHRDVDSSIVSLRLMPNPTLKEAPAVVGMKRQGLKGARVEAQVVLDSKTTWGRENPFRPGSRDYVAAENMTTSQIKYAPVHRPVRSFRNGLGKASSFKAQGAASRDNLLDSLMVITNTNKDEPL